MKTLLKDMPEFAERIENNFLLGEEIKDSLTEPILDTDFDKSTQDDIMRRISQVLRDEIRFEIEDGKVVISNKEDVVQAIWGEVKSGLEDEIVSFTNKGEIVESIREKLTEFVNQNYTFKGI